MTRVWAPRARRVDVVVGDDRVALAGPDAVGWFRGDPLPPGTDYGFSLDGGPVRADPRSPWQPHGSAGRSRTVDHGSFRWADDSWHGSPLAGSVLYELHVGTFTPVGTFDAAIAHLDELAELGVTTIELMPVAEFTGRRGWGYDGVFWYAPHHAYGGPDGMKRFVDAAHRRGLAVLLDVVYNHFGPADCYIDEFGPYTHDTHTTAWGRAINLDGPDSDEVRRFVLDSAHQWLRDYHLDGLRLDATDTLVDDRALPILEELADSVRNLSAHLHRPLVLVAENDRNDPRLTEPTEAGGSGLDGQWSDDFHHALHAVLTGERHSYYADFGDPADIATAFNSVQVYDGRRSPTKRRGHGRPVPPDARRNRFVVCSQNHDQVGNRARGERLVHVTDPARARLAAALTLTHPGTPLLFQGEEWGASTPFPYFVDVDGQLADDVRRGRLAEFGAFGWDTDEIPDPTLESTFRSAVLDRTERGRPGHADLWAWYRTLLALRREEPALTGGSTTARLDGVVLVVERGGSIRVAANLTGERTSFVGPAVADVLAASEWSEGHLGPWGVVVSRFPGRSPG